MVTSEMSFIPELWEYALTDRLNHDGTFTRSGTWRIFTDYNAQKQAEYVVVHNGQVVLAVVVPGGSASALQADWKALSGFIGQIAQAICQGKTRPIDRTHHTFEIADAL